MADDTTIFEPEYFGAQKPPEEVNPITGFARGLYRGAVYGVPEQLAKAGQFARTGLGMGESETLKNVAEWGRTGLGTEEKGMFEQAGEMTPQSVGIPLAATAVGKLMELHPNPLVKAAGTAVRTTGQYITPAVFGLAQAQETREKAQKAGVDEGAAPYLTGGVEWAGETAGNMALARLFGPFAAVGKAATEAIGKMTATAALKGTLGAYLKELATVTLPTEILTEMGQNYVETMIENKYGIDTTTIPWESAKQAIGPTAIMTSFLAPFGKFAQNHVANKQASILSAPVDLNSENAQEAQMTRLAVARKVAEIIPNEQEGLREQWINYASQRISKNLPIDIATPMDQLGLSIQSEIDSMPESTSINSPVDLASKQDRTEETKPPTAMRQTDYGLPENYMQEFPEQQTQPAETPVVAPAAEAAPAITAPEVPAIEEEVAPEQKKVSPLAHELFYSISNGEVPKTGSVALDKILKKFLEKRTNSSGIINLSGISPYEMDALIDKYNEKAAKMNKPGSPVLDKEAVPWLMEEAVPEEVAGEGGGGGEGIAETPAKPDATPADVESGLKGMKNGEWFEVSDPVNKDNRAIFRKVGDNEFHVFSIEDGKMESSKYSYEEMLRDMPSEREDLNYVRDSIEGRKGSDVPMPKELIPQGYNEKRGAFAKPQIVQGTNTDSPGRDIDYNTVKGPRQAALHAIENYLDKAFSGQESEAKAAHAQGIPFKDFFAKAVRKAHYDLSTLYSERGNETAKEKKQNMVLYHAIQKLFETANNLDAGKATKLTNANRWEAFRDAYGQTTEEIEKSMGKSHKEWVEEAIQGSPVHQALRDIRASAGLNYDAFAKDYGKAQIIELQKKHPGILSKKGAAHLDTMADVYGFEGGDELLQALLEAKSTDELVKEYKDQYFAGERYTEMEMTTKGFEKVKGSVSATNLDEGDQIWHDGEAYKVTDISNDGTVTLKDGETIKLDPDENIQIEGIKKAERNYTEETGNLPGIDDVFNLATPEGTGSAGELKGTMNMTPSERIQFEGSTNPTFAEDIKKSSESDSIRAISKYEKELADNPSKDIEVPKGERIGFENQLYDLSKDRKDVSIEGNIGEGVFTINRPYGTFTYYENTGKIVVVPPSVTDDAKVSNVKFGTDKTLLLQTISKDIVSNDLGRTIANETIQNALDAVEKNSGTKGIIVNIEELWDNDPRDGEYKKFTRVVVEDNGKGMTAAQVRAKLLKLGAKGKEGTTTRGGFGLAKASFILIPERTEVTTTRNGITSVLRGTREQFFEIKGKGTPTIEESNTGLPNGTKFDMVFYNYDSAASKYNTYELYIQDAVRNFEDAIQNGVFVDGVIFNLTTPFNSLSKKSEDISKSPQKFAPRELSFKGNDMRINFLKRDVNTLAYSFAGTFPVDIGVMNQGLLMRSIRESRYGSWQNPDWKVIVDFKKTVAPDSIDYPFIKNRTEMNQEILGEIQKIIGEKIDSENQGYHDKSKSEFEEMVNKSPVVNGIRVLIPFVDDAEFQKASESVKSNPKIMSDVASVFTSFQNLLHKIGEKKIELCLTVDPSVHGFRSNPRVVSKEFYAINPFAVTEELSHSEEFKEMREEGFDANTILSGNFTHTLVHEYAHAYESGHGESYSLKLAHLYRKMSHGQLARLEQQIRRFYEEHGEELGSLQSDFSNLGQGGTRLQQDNSVVQSQESNAGRIFRFGRNEGVRTGEDIAEQKAASAAIAEAYDKTPVASKILTELASMRTRGGSYRMQDFIKVYEDATGAKYRFAFLTPILDKIGTKISLDVNRIRPAMRDVSLAVYDMKTGDIILNDKFDLVKSVPDSLAEVLAHEALHAVIEKGLNSKARSTLNWKIKSFVASLKPHLKDADPYVRRNFSLIDGKSPDEIINFAFTNQKFAEWLDSIKVEGQGTKSETFWGKLKGIILKAFNGVADTSKTKLDELNEIMDRAIGLDASGLAGVRLPVPKTQKQKAAMADLFADTKDFIGTFTGKAEKMPQGYEKSLTKAIENLGGLKYKYVRQVLSLPYQMSKEHSDWRVQWNIQEDRIRERMTLISDISKIADPFFNREKTLKAEGYTPEQIKDATHRIGRIITIGDENLRNELHSLQTRLADRELSEAARQKIIDKIAFYQKERRYSDEELLKGIRDEDNKATVKLKNQTEIDMYKSVRAAEDEIMRRTIDHLGDMVYLSYQNKKWYRVLAAALGRPPGKQETMEMVRSGMDDAAVAYMKSIHPDLDQIWKRIDDGISKLSDKETKDVLKAYEKMSQETQYGLRGLKDVISRFTGEKDPKKLENITREVFGAYLLTRPQLQGIRKLRNDFNEWIGFFPRHREFGNFKVQLVEDIVDNETGETIDTKPIHSEFIKTKWYQTNEAEGAKLINRILQKYGDKNGKLPEGQRIVIDPVVQTPEGAFQGVNDVNVQKVLDDALKHFSAERTYFDNEGNEVQVRNALWDAVLDVIKSQLQTRGSTTHMMHRQQDIGDKAIKGYLEENHDKILLDHITAMAGLITKQKAALRSFTALGNLKDKSLWEELADYNKGQFRNDTALDMASSKIRSFAFTWYLGGMIKSAFVNMTQPYIVGVPMLSRYLKEHDLGGFFKANKIQGAASWDIATNNLTSLERNFVEELTKDGSMKAQYIDYVRGATQDKFTQGWNKALDYLALPFRNAEEFNRKTSGLAMFRVAYDMYSKTMSEQQAYQAAVKDAHTFIDDVHYPIGKHNLPLMAQTGDKMGVALKTAYTFRSFTHNFLLNQYNLLRWQGKTKQQAWRDIQAFGQTMAYMWMFGGMMGLPFLKEMLELFEKMFGYSPVNKVRKMLRGIGGKTLETFGVSGLPSVLGMNISGSLAIGIPFVGEEPSDTMYGVYGGLGTKIKRGMEAAHREDWYRAASNFAPEFFRGPLTAATESQVGKQMFGTPGVVVTPRGKVVYDENGKPLTMNAYEAGLKTLGFSPTEVSRQKEVNAELARLEKWANESKANISETYRIAKLQGNADAMKNMMKSVKDFNEKLKDRDLEKLIPKATVATIVKNARERKTTQQRREQRYKQSET